MSPKPSRQPVRVEAERWSRSSKQSLRYLNPPRTYKDIHYKCCCCNAPGSFTAEQQKEAFEIRQAYIWQRHILCESCFRERRRLESLARASSRRWAKEKSVLARDRDFLGDWLGVLEALPKYAARKNHANISMLKKKLATLS
jgi:hypothetical protein